MPSDSQVVAAASLLLCYIYWWVALSVMRSAQFKANKEAAEAAASGKAGADVAAGGRGALDERLVHGSRRLRSPSSADRAADGSGPVKFDNHDQTNSKAALTGRGRRAMLAMNNHAEQLPQFGLALVLNLALRGGQCPWAVAGVMAGVAVFRGLHLACYLSDQASIRSLTFLFSTLLTFALYALAFVDL